MFSAEERNDIPRRGAKHRNDDSTGKDIGQCLFPYHYPAMVQAPFAGADPVLRYGYTRAAAVDLFLRAVNVKTAVRPEKKQKTPDRKISVRRYFLLDKHRERMVQSIVIMGWWAHIPFYHPQSVV